MREPPSVFVCVSAWNATDALLGHFNCLSPTVIKPREIKNGKKDARTEEMEWKSCERATLSLP